MSEKKTKAPKTVAPIVVNEEQNVVDSTNQTEVNETVMQERGVKNPVELPPTLKDEKPAGKFLPKVVQSKQFQDKQRARQREEELQSRQILGLEDLIPTQKESPSFFQKLGWFVSRTNTWDASLRDLIGEMVLDTNWKALLVLGGWCSKNLNTMDYDVKELMSEVSDCLYMVAKQEHALNEAGHSAIEMSIGTTVNAGIDWTKTRWFWPSRENREALEFKKKMMPRD
jgi:hypothetical protein